RHKVAGRVEIGEGFENPPGEAVLPLYGLIRVHGRADGHVFPAPPGAGQLPAQHRYRVHFDEHLALEARAGVHVQVLVVPPRITVDARVNTAPVRVDGPAEGQVRPV